MGWHNSTSGGSLPETGTNDENDPNYVAGGDPNQAPSSGTPPKWKQYMSDMMGAMPPQQNQSQNQGRNGGAWTGAGNAAGAGLAKLFKLGPQQD